MNYYNEIKEILLKNEVYTRVKDYSKERNKVITYFGIGKLLSEAGKKYGKNIIKQYSEKLMVEVGKKYNERNLRYMRQFYETFKDIKWNPAGAKLSWSHYRELLVVNNTNAIRYYIDICEKNNLTKIQLREKIKSHEYDRLSEETKNKLIVSEQLKVDDLVPNPIIIKTNVLNENLKKTSQDRTVGIIIVKKSNKYVIEYCSNDKIIAKEYELV